MAEEEHPYKKTVWIRKDDADRESPLTVINPWNEKDPRAYIPFVGNRPMTEKDLKHPLGRAAHQMGKDCVQGTLVPEGLRRLEVRIRPDGDYAGSRADWDPK